MLLSKAAVQPRQNLALLGLLNSELGAQLFPSMEPTDVGAHLGGRGSSHTPGPACNWEKLRATALGQEWLRDRCKDSKGGPLGFQRCRHFSSHQHAYWYHVCSKLALAESQVDGESCRPFLLQAISAFTWPCRASTHCPCEQRRFLQGCKERKQPNLDPKTVLCAHNPIYLLIRLHALEKQTMCIAEMVLSFLKRV